MLSALVTLAGVDRFEKRSYLILIVVLYMIVAPHQKVRSVEGEFILFVSTLAFMGFTGIFLRDFSSLIGDETKETSSDDPILSALQLTVDFLGMYEILLVLGKRGNK